MGGQDFGGTGGGLSTRPIDPSAHDERVEDHLEEPTPLPRGAGADVPQSDRADDKIALEYTEQNFNALAAANTAMQTQISSDQILLGAKDETIVELNGRIDFQAATVKDLRAERDRALERASRAEEAAARMSDENLYLKDRERELQRKVDRFSGYLDRLLDEEEAFKAEPTHTVTAPKPPVGPDISGIPEAVRRGRNGDSDWSVVSARLAPDEYRERPRRY